MSIYQTIIIAIIFASVVGLATYAIARLQGKNEKLQADIERLEQNPGYKEQRIYLDFAATVIRLEKELELLRTKLNAARLGNYNPDE